MEKVTYRGGCPTKKLVLKKIGETFKNCHFWDKLAEKEFKMGHVSNQKHIFFFFQKSHKQIIRFQKLFTLHMF